MIIIRQGSLDDAPDLARMISDFNVEEGSSGRIDGNSVIDLCFRDRSLYTSLVADVDGQLVGYALLMRFFDTEPCAWVSYMQDLFVVPASRSQGVGEQLIAAAADHTLKEGRIELAWHVRSTNDRGRAFYARIGGVEQRAIPVTLSGDALKHAAKKAAEKRP